MDDLRLLDEYAQSGSEAAFTQLVNRYSNMVYGVCLRQLKDPALAEDATQAVFLILASKAGDLRKNVVLGGWLFQTAKFAAGNALKLESRRKRAERDAAEFKNEKVSDEKTRDALTAAILDETLLRLNVEERNVLILRYYRGLDMPEIGAELKISTDAAEKRISRALERLKIIFFKEGFVCSLPALAGVLAANAKHVAPAALAARLAHDCALGLHATATGGAAIAKGTIATMNGLKLKVVLAAIGGAVLLAGSAGYVGYAAGRSEHPRPTAQEQQVNPPPLTRVDSRDSQSSLFAARIEYGRQYALTELNQRIANEAKLQCDIAIAMEKAGQVTKVDVSNAELGYKTVQFEVLQGKRRLADAKAKLEELAGPKDEALTHAPAALDALGVNKDLETDEAKRTVSMVSTKDGKVVSTRTLFKPVELSQSDVAAALKNRPEGERAAVLKRLAGMQSDLNEKEAALLLEAQRAHFAIVAAEGSKISFERGLVTNAELQHAMSEKLKTEAEFVNKRADYLLQLGTIYELLGRDPETIKLEDDAAPQPRAGEPNF